jgi:Flp pilus assembly protein TadD
MVKTFEHDRPRAGSHEGLRRPSKARSAVYVAVAAACLLGAWSPAGALTDDRAAAVRHYVDGADAASAGNRAAALHEYLAGEAADPTYSLNYFASAGLEVQGGDYAAAQAQLQRLIALSPRTPYAHYYLALVLEAQQRDDVALKNFDAELQINPTYAPAKRARKQLLAAFGPAILGTAASAPSPTASPALRAAMKIAAHPTAEPTPVFRNFPGPTPWPTATALPPPPKLAMPAPKLAMPSPTPSPRPFVLTPRMMAEAKGYLLEIARDVAFTQALPPAGAPQEPDALERTIQSNLSDRGSYDVLVSSGTAALCAGRPDLAREAFDAASQKRPNDWRAPYLEGMAAQSDGDLQAARALFAIGLERERRPEILTSLAIVDVRLNDLARASAEAESGAALDAGYQPAQFTAGLIPLALGDAATASRLLQAAVALDHAPARTAFFLDLAQRAAAAK